MIDLSSENASIINLLNETQDNSVICLVDEKGKKTLLMSQKIEQKKETSTSKNKENS